MGQDNEFGPESRTYCQIVGRDITAPACLSKQGEEGCFGCSAPTRLCEVCKRRPVDVSAVGMCSHCLTSRLKSEQSMGKPRPERLRRVQCQIAKTEISATMCYATQGQEGCRNCAAVTRICENCKERPVRFHQYGLCLTCSVEEFGGGWKPLGNVQAEAAVVELPIVAPEPRAAGPVQPTNGAVKQRTRKDLAFIGIRWAKDDAPAEAQSALSLGQSSLPEPAPADAFPVSTVPVLQFESGTKIIAEVEFEELVRRGQELVSSGIVGPLSTESTAEVHEGYDQEGSPKNYRDEETVVRGGEDMGTTRAGAIVAGRGGNIGSANQASTCQKCDKPAWFKQIGMCRSHGTQYYRQQKKRILKGGRIRKLPAEGELQKLCGHAKDVIIKNRQASNSFLMKKLGIEFYTAQEVLRRLEADGVIGPGNGPRPREVMVDKNGKGNPMAGIDKAIPRYSLPQKIKVLKEFKKFFGEENVTSGVIRSIMEDLDNYRHLKETLRKLGKD